MNQKKLSFIYAYPLDRERRSLFEEKGLEYPSIEEVKSVCEHWEKVWAETDTEKGIIGEITSLTKRVPERNLECFVFGAGLQAMSTPFLFPIRNKEGQQWADDTFVEIIIHELLHIFLSTNNNLYWEKAQEKFVNEAPLCSNHILLYAMLYKIYQGFFNREPRDFNRDNLPAGYARAINLVKEHGYKELIAEYNELISKKS